MSLLATAQPLPVYLQIAELLIRQIKAGYWREGERLPAEASLARELHIAVGTLRKALALLATQGVVERRHGSGTYVRTTIGTKPIYELFRLELVNGPGLPTAHALDVSRVARPADMAILGANAQSPVWRVRRLRLLSQTPVALEEIYFDAGLCTSLAVQDIGDSMYLLYRERFGLHIARVEDRLCVAATPQWACAPFALAPGACAGYIERISWSAANQVAECSRTWFDPAVCRYTARMSQ